MKKQSEFTVVLRLTSKTHSEPKFLKEGVRVKSPSKAFDVYLYKGVHYVVENGLKGWVHTVGNTVYPVIYVVDLTKQSVTRGSAINWDRHTLRSGTMSFHKGNANKIGFTDFNKAMEFIETNLAAYRPTYTTCHGVQPTKYTDTRK